MRKALITGASSGLGRDLARVLSGRGYDLILVARRRDRLEALARTLPTKARIICADLSDANRCKALYDETRGEHIDLLVNNAGFGRFGAFFEADLDMDLRMIDTNIRAVHILTKLFLRDFAARDSGYILNVASMAGFMPGPGMACYYATKAYVLRLTQSIGEELRRRKSAVYIGALCPGPVSTEFGATADVRFRMPSLPSVEVAAYAVDQMFRRKRLIIPGRYMKAMKFAARLAPESLLARVCGCVNRPLLRPF